tara:strand:+ start:1899 stop:2120 length:222 start_codon:yes stop_codon:yes gene_type:complete
VAYVNNAAPSGEAACPTKALIQSVYARQLGFLPTAAQIAAGYPKPSIKKLATFNPPIRISPASSMTSDAIDLP